MNTIAEDFGMLLVLLREHVHPSRVKKMTQWGEKTAAVLAVLVAAVFGWEQFLEGRAQNSKSLAEASFASAREQLVAASPAIRASAVRSIFELSFTETIAEPSLLKGFPGQYTLNWLCRRRDYPILERGKSLLKEFALSDPLPNSAAENIVSSALLAAGLDITNRESIAHGVPSAGNAGLLLHRAKLPRARANNRNLDDIDFGAADFSGANLSGCRLNGVGLAEANLEKAVLNGCTLVESNFLRANLSEVDFSFSNLSKTVFRQSGLAQANFTRATINGADFSAATLRLAVFRGSMLRGTNFQHANIQHADFSQSDISKAEFDDADLEAADFRFASGVETAKWKGARNLDKAKFPPGFRPQL